jgi:hypothetical protein
MTGAEQFIASLVHALAWPGAVVLLALGFRKQIAKLLAKPVRRLRAGPVELEFRWTEQELRTPMLIRLSLPGGRAAPERRRPTPTRAVATGVRKLGGR